MKRDREPKTDRSRPSNFVEMTFSVEYTVGEPIPLESAISGRVAQTAKGSLYLVESGVDGLLEAGDHFLSDASLFFGCSEVNLDRMRELDEQLADLAVLDPDRLLFLDIETCGFHGTPLFLVGLLSYKGGAFRISQLFARDYSEEAAVLQHLSEFYLDHQAVVTFNGRSFDLPFINERASFHGVQLRRPDLDFDLLAASRRVWKETLPNCRLGTLEECVCGRCRAGDLPSSLIPDTYARFVQTGDARPMIDVFRHNAYDLVTMAHLLARIAGGKVELLSEPRDANSMVQNDVPGAEKARRARTGTAASSVSGMLSGKTFVFTGKLESMERTEAEDLVRSLGGMACSSVSGSTDFVVAGPGAGAKLDDARQRNLGIMNEAAFLKMIGRR